MTSVQVLLKCPGSLESKVSFSEETTIGDIKSQFCCPYLKAHFQDVQILSEGFILDDSISLKDIQPAKRWFGKKRTLNLHVQVNENPGPMAPALTGLSTEVDIPITEMRLSTLFTEGSTHADVPNRMLEIFQKADNTVVDQLYHSMSGQIDRDTVLSLYSASLGETTSPKDAAKQFYDIMCEYGLIHYWDDTTSAGLDATAASIHNDSMNVMPSPDEATIALEESTMRVYVLNDVPSQDEATVAQESSTHISAVNNSTSKATTAQEGFASSSVKVFTCEVCYEELRINDKFVMFCKDSHELCYDCAVQDLEAKAKSGIAQIQCFAQGCEHELSMTEIALALGRGHEALGRKDPLFSQIDRLKLDFALTKDPREYCTCPREGCKWTVARSQRGAIEKVTCGDCNLTFCTNCLDTYHYRTTCTECRQIQRAWRSWVVRDRSAYWRLDNEMHQKARQTAQAESKRIAEITRAEELDETHKARTCRHCPHCDRIVERLAGCSIMRCGYDTDTRGNVQNGCQNRFDWDKARPYKPVEAGKQVKLVATPVEEKPLHEGWQCDECHQEIRGLRFECINCASYYICERCDNNDGSHISGHIFRIHTGM